MLMGHGKKTTAKSETGNLNQLFTGAADGEKDKYVACLHVVGLSNQIKNMVDGCG